MARTKKDNHPCHDVEWFLRWDSKKPFTYSTRAERDLIDSLAEEFTTVQDTYNAFCDGRLNHDEKAIEILGAVIADGRGGILLRDYLSRKSPSLESEAAKKAITAVEQFTTMLDNFDRLRDNGKTSDRALISRWRKLEDKYNSVVEACRAVPNDHPIHAEAYSTWEHRFCTIQNSLGDLVD